MHVIFRIWQAAQLALQKTLDDAAKAAAERARVREVAKGVSKQGAAGVYHIALNKGPVAWARDHILIVMWAPVVLTGALVAGIGGVLGWGWAQRFGGWIRNGADYVFTQGSRFGSLIVIGAAAYVLIQIMERRK